MKEKREGTPVASLGRHPYSLIRSISGLDRFSRMVSPLFVQLWLFSGIIHMHDTAPLCMDTRNTPTKYAVTEQGTEHFIRLCW